MSMVIGRVIAPSMGTEVLVKPTRGALMGQSWMADKDILEKAS